MTNPEHIGDHNPLELTRAKSQTEAILQKFPEEVRKEILETAFNSLGEKEKAAFLAKFQGKEADSNEKKAEYKAQEKIREDAELLPNSQDYLMEYDTEGNSKQEPSDYSSQIKEFLQSLPEIKNAYWMDKENIPLLYRGVSLTLQDLQDAMMRDGLEVAKTDPDKTFFTSQPEDALGHAFTAGIDIPRKNNQRIAVMIAISPKLLAVSGLHRKDPGVFYCALDIPKEVLQQSDIYVYNHKHQRMDKIDILTKTK